MHGAPSLQTETPIQSEDIMRHSVLTTSLAALIIAWSTPALAQEGVTASEYDADMVLVTLGEDEITLGHLALLNEQSGGYFARLPEEARFPALLDQAVTELVLAQAAEANGIADTRAAQLAMDVSRRRLLASAQAEAVFDQGVSEADIQAAYAEYVADDASRSEFNASHILVATEAEALALIEELNTGADFAELARIHSTGPTGPNGGNLNWFASGAMVGPFDAAVKEMEVGEVAGPVQTQFGWHVIKLNDTRSTPPEAFEAVRSQLEQELRSAAFGEYLDAMRETSGVDISNVDLPYSALESVTLSED